MENDHIWPKIFLWFFVSKSILKFFMGYLGTFAVIWHYEAKKLRIIEKIGS